MTTTTTTTIRQRLFPAALRIIILIALSYFVSFTLSSAAEASGESDHHRHENNEVRPPQDVVVPRAVSSENMDSSSTIAPSHGRMRFLAIGDWGGKDTYPFYTEEQWETAVGMARVASASSSSTTAAAGYPSADANGEKVESDSNTNRPAASFVLSLGDNFYSRGIPEEDTTPEAYLRFEETFDNVYDRSVMDMPWFIVGGNHDHCGDITLQMKLSETCDRWNFPDYNHRIVREFYAGGHNESNDTANLVKLEIIMIDTVHLAGETPCPHAEDVVGTVYPSEFFQYLPHEDDESLARAATTLGWIENALMESDADYLIVAGHYPIYSACSHGGNEALQNKLDPLLRKYGVTAYLSGHEHCQFHFSYEGMDYILSGAGHNCCYSSKKKKSLPKRGEMKYLLADSKDYSGSAGVRGGFASFDVGRDEMSFALHRESGDVLYESVLLPRASHFRRGERGVDVAVEVE